MENGWTSNGVIYGTIIKQYYPALYLRPDFALLNEIFTTFVFGINFISAEMVSFLYF